MRLTKLGGITVLADTTLYQAEKISALFVANAAVSVGMNVGLTTSNTAGKLVVKTPASANSDHLSLGIYEGEGGTGALTTTSGLTGRDAAANDLIWVTIYGLATALVDGTTTDATDGNALTPSVTTAGELESLANTFAAGAKPIYTCLETNTGATAAKKVFVRGM